MPEPTTPTPPTPAKLMALWKEVLWPEAMSTEEVPIEAPFAITFYKPEDSVHMEEEHTKELLCPNETEKLAPGWFVLADYYTGGFSMRYYSNGTDILTSEDLGETTYQEERTRA